MDGAQLPPMYEAVLAGTRVVIGRSRRWLVMDCPDRGIQQVIHKVNLPSQPFSKVQDGIVCAPHRDVRSEPKEEAAAPRPKGRKPASADAIRLPRDGRKAPSARPRRFSATACGRVGVGDHSS